MNPKDIQKAADEAREYSKRTGLRITLKQSRCLLYFAKQGVKVRLK